MSTLHDAGLVGSAARHVQPLVGAQGRPPRGGAVVLLDIFARSADRDCDCDRGPRVRDRGRAGQIFGTLRGLLGESGTQAIDAMLKGANRPREGLIATIIGVGTLVFAAVGVMVQLKDAMNTVWEVETPPGPGVWRFARTYVLSLAGVLAVGFLLLVSMLVTATLSAAGKYIAPYLPEAAFQIIAFIASFAIIALLFAMMFKWLPDIDIAWRDVWPGAILTAALFELGKFLIGLYIGKQGLESTYGAAASIVVVLIWVYYSAQLILMGAEFTAVYAQRYGSRRTQGSSRQGLASVDDSRQGRVGILGA
jgi:membrane protein